MAPLMVGAKVYMLAGMRVVQRASHLELLLVAWKVLMMVATMALYSARRMVE